jgi:hypothetical protein
VRSVVRVHPGLPTFRLPGRGRSSVGRAPALQAGCRRFDSVRLHHLPKIVRRRSESKFGCLDTLRGVDGRIFRHRKEMHCCLFDPYPGRETANAREFWFFFDLTDQNRSTSRKVWIIRSSPKPGDLFKRGHLVAGIDNENDQVS